MRPTLYPILSLNVSAPTLLSSDEATSSAVSGSYNQTHTIDAAAGSVLVLIGIESDTPGVPVSISSVTLGGESPSSQGTEATQGNMTLNWFTFPASSTGNQTLAITGSDTMVSASSVSWSLSAAATIRDDESAGTTGNNATASGLSTSGASLVFGGSVCRSDGLTVNITDIDNTDQFGSTGGGGNDHAYSAGHFDDLSTSVSYTWSGSANIIVSIAAVG